MRTTLVVAGALIAFQVHTADAQWHFGLGVGRDSYSGVSNGEFENGNGSFRPYHPLVWSVRVEGRAMGATVSVDVRYAKPDIGLVGGEVTLIPHGSFLEMAGLAPALGWEVVELAPGVRIEGEVGPVLELWRVETVGNRVLLGATGAVALRIGLGGRFSARLAGRVGVTPSSPLAGALIEGYTPKTAWRRGLEGGVLFRL